MTDKNERRSACDKCGGPVLPSNDTTFVMAELYDDPIIIIAAQGRHFLPEGDCLGSPSRAQYIAGQPRDTRGYPYNPENEEPYRQAYARVQSRYGHQADRECPAL